MSGELDRFQRERAQEMGYVLRDFALVQARLGGDSAKLWGSLVARMGAGVAPTEQASAAASMQPA